MRTYTEKEWAKAQYTGRWGDTPWNRDRVEAGELPAKYIGRRYIMVGRPSGCTLITEGVHFLVNDEEGRVVAKAEGLKMGSNKYYKTSDGWFDYYVNVETGEKKFKLDEYDVCVERKRDDFYRPHARA